MRFSETNDLIYEGIATFYFGFEIHDDLTPETNDLIYEGIATIRAWTICVTSG